MSASSHPHMTAEAFVEWAMRQPEGMRYELVAGEVVLVSMAPERLIHALTKKAITRRLDEAIEEAGLSCTVFPDGVGVAIDEDTVFEPDATVYRGPPLPGDDTLVREPLIIVEVRSPSTGGRDTGEKFEGYLRLPSLRHYLIVIAKTRAIVHHARSLDGSIATTIVRDGPVRLDPPGIVLDGVWPAGSTPG